MKTRLFHLSVVLLITATTLGGCSGSDGAECDEGYVADGSSCILQISTGDADPKNDPESPDDADGPTDTDNSNDVTPQDLEFTPANAQGATTVGDPQVWVLAASQDDVLLRVEVLESFGGPTAPGVTDFGDAETSYETCGTCVILRTGCSAIGSEVTCEKTFMPRVGASIAIEAIGPRPGDRFSGTFRNLEFQEVTIAAADYATQPIAGGERMLLDEWAFDVELDSLVGPQPELCGGHGDLHGSHCHCDPGYSPEPGDATNCVPD